MAMRVDPAGQHQHPIGIKPGCPFEAVGQGGDAAAAYADIAAHRIGAGDDDAAANDEVVFRHESAFAKHDTPPRVANGPALCQPFPP